MSVEKIISGGQSGADQGGLFAGYALGLKTGGWAPKNYQTEDGPARDLLRFFGLSETEIIGYEYRTNLNVWNSDGTVLFGDIQSAGSRLTGNYIKMYSKPNVHFDVPFKHQGARQYLLEWVEKNGIVTLNVAGNRESRNPGIRDRVTDFLVEVFS